MQDIARVMPTYRYAHPAWGLLAKRGIQWSDVLILLAYTIGFVALAAFIQRRMAPKPEAG